MNDTIGMILTIALPICITSVILVFVFGIVAITFGPMLFRLASTSRAKHQALQSGVLATATILSTWDTGVLINHQPRMGMRLQVQPPDGLPFETQLEETVALIHIPMFQPGAQVQVKYDPANPKNIAIVGAGAAMNAPQAEQILLQIQAKNEQLMASGTEATAKVLQYQSMGINVNGNNPAVTLQVEVQPVGGPKFSAQVQGVIMESSIPKFQPGQLITVKYNPNDLTQAAIVRSGV